MPPAQRGGGAGGGEGAVRGTGKPTAAGGEGAGGAGGGAAAPPDEHAGWAALVRRIDAQDSIMPADAAVMLSAEDLFAPPRGRRPAADVVAGTRGAVDEEPAPARGFILGLPAPRLITATLGITPAPFGDAEVVFFEDGEAARWQAEWPALRRKLATNPLVALTGFSSLVEHITLESAGATVHVHLEATELELVRLLQLLSSQLIPFGGR